MRGEEKHRKVPLYTIFSNPANINEFATAGRDQYARCVHAIVHSQGCLSLSHRYYPFRVYDRRKIVLVRMLELCVIILVL